MQRKEFLWWVIRSTGGDPFSDDPEPLYWSNKDGWVDQSQRDTFSNEEKSTVNLPLDGEWEPVYRMR